MPEVLTFKIEDFEGPLDLLLYLVGKNKMNLYDVNIMELIEQYTAAIREMQQDRMEISSEFIDMAAHLVQMKSALLLPRSPEAERMKAELTGRLIEYSACKEVAAQLGIPTGTPILRISRLCTADGRPAIYCEDVVEKAKLQRPYTAEELRQPIFDFLQNVCGISSYLDLTDLRPVAADAALADVFQVPQGTPLLNMDEVDYDIEGAPVFASNEYFADGIFHHTVLRKKL